MIAELAGKVWVFTLGTKDGSTPGGTKVVEIGPVAGNHRARIFAARQLRLGPPGAETPVHMHPGSEAFYVVAGRLAKGPRMVWPMSRQAIR